MINVKHKITNKNELKISTFMRIVFLLCMITTMQAFSQGITITGTVTDSQGETLPGVNVLVKGTSIGAVTDFNGRYSINVPDQNAVLVFSFIGYATQEHTVSDQRIIQVTLAEESTMIDEVVVTALGIKRAEKSLGYSVQTVKGEALTTVILTSFIK